MLSEGPIPRPKRHAAPVCIAAVTLAAAALYSSHSAASSPAAAAVAPVAPERAFFQELASARAFDDDDDYTDEDGLYLCDNGVPSVPEAYKNGSWGSIYGDWYVVAANIGRSNPSSGDCCRMSFNSRDDAMNQHMMYSRGDTDYYWNYTGNDAIDTGLWENVGMSMYSDFWSSVYMVGEYDGHRYFGWYFCGPAVSVTKRGIPWVLTDDYSLQTDETFTTMIEEKLESLGLLTAGNFTTYVQESSCDYTWHHTGDEIE